MQDTPFDHLVLQGIEHRVILLNIILIALTEKEILTQDETIDVIAGFPDHVLV
jgi:hypothetical protein